MLGSKAQRKEMAGSFPVGCSDLKTVSLSGLCFNGREVREAIGSVPVRFLAVVMGTCRRIRAVGRRGSVVSRRPPPDLPDAGQRYRL